MAELARAADAALFAAGRWQAWRHALGRGLDTAKAIGDDAAAAFFSHQLGSLAVCHDQRQDADRLLRDALTLREQLGDPAGAALTRHNLRMLELPKPPRRPPRRDRLDVLARGSQLAKLAVAIGGLALVGGGIAFGVGHGSGTVTVRTTVTASPVARTSSAAATPPAASATATAQTQLSTPGSPPGSASTTSRTLASGASSASTSSAPVVVPNVIGMGQTPATDSHRWRGGPAGLRRHPHDRRLGLQAVGRDHAD